MHIENTDTFYAPLPFVSTVLCCFGDVCKHLCGAAHEDHLSVHLLCDAGCWKSTSVPERLPDGTVLQFWMAM